MAFNVSGIFCLVFLYTRWSLLFEMFLLLGPVIKTLASHCQLYIVLGFWKNLVFSPPGNSDFSLFGKIILTQRHF
jgi:hypothetical protein